MPRRIAQLAKFWIILFEEWTDSSNREEKP
jgi:hypothetical protein